MLLRKKSKSLQRQMYFSYSIILVAVCLILMLVTVFYVSSIMLRNSGQSLLATAKTVSVQFDNKIAAMDAVIEQVFFNSNIRDLYFDGLSDEDQAQQNKNRFELEDSLNKMIVPQFAVQNISIFDMQGKYAQAGYPLKPAGELQAELQHLDWFDDVIDANGNKVIIPSRAETLGFHPADVFSLCRSAVNYRRSAPPTIVEVQKPYAEIERLISDTVITSTPGQSKAFILNKDGQIVYPMAREVQNSPDDYIRLLQDQNDGYGTAEFRVAGDVEIVSYYYSIYTGYYILVTSPKSVLLEPVLGIIGNFLIFFILLLLAILAISYFVSKNITNPLMKLNMQMKALDYPSLFHNDTFTYHKGDSTEIKQLGDSFEKMRQSLRISMEKAVNATVHARQSSVLALQAQMNPHFLYNIITNLSTMAEESGNEDIYNVCIDLTEMLRYILSPATDATIEQEIRCTQQYLQLMKVRYEDKLQYRIDTPAKLLQIVVPKMILQPLVENVIKYGLGDSLPWMIQITGTSTASSWSLAVQDNGDGFDPEVIQTLEQQFEKFDPSDSLLDLYDKNIGLLNIYARLYMFYGNSMQLRISNNDIGGCVTIGGTIEQPKED